MFRQAPLLCGRLFAMSAAAAASRQAAGACPAGATAAAAVGGANAAAAASRGPSPAPSAAAGPVCGFAASAAAGPPTIFEKLGGKPAVTAAVEKFYEKVLADPVVNGFFKNTDMAAQKRKQMSFMMYAFGGPEAYKGKDMFEAHKTMDLSETHFNHIVKHFVDTLTELGVKQHYIDEACAVVATTKDAILKTGEYAVKK